MILRAFLTLFFAGMLISLMGQNNFHRVYTVDPGHHTKNQTAVQFSDGKFASLDLLEDTLRDAANDLLITLYDKKGGIASRAGNNGAKAFRITTLDRKQLFLPQHTSLTMIDKDFIFTGLIQENDSIRKVYGSLNPSGQLNWMYRYTSVSGSRGLNTPFLLTEFGKNIYLGTNQSFLTRSLVSLAKANQSGLLEWSARYIITRDSVGGALLNNTLTHLSRTRDTTLLVAGFMQNNTNRLPFILEADTLGNAKWSKLFFDTLNNYFITDHVEAIKLADSTYVIAGNVDSLNGVSVSFGLILRADTLGNVVWGRKLTFGDNTRTKLTNLAVGNDGMITVSGIMRDSVSSPDFHWLTKIKLNGDIDLVKKYPRVNVDRRINGNLVAAMDSGYAIFSTVDDGGNYLNLIKTDINGESTCETDFPDDILSPVDFQSTDLYWNTLDTAVIERADVKTDEYILNPKIVMLNREPVYCPKDTINHLFDATVEDAVYYEWSTGVKGDSASMITVFDTEQYTVIVTIDDGRECLTLCDTAMLRRYTTPQANIVFSLGDFCTTGLITLNANILTAEAGVKTILWNTGATTGSIKVGEAGLYSVTITDNCDEVAVAMYDLFRMPQIITAVNIIEDFSTICQTRTGVLSAVDNSFGLFPKIYAWSNGASTQAIEISKGGSYCVTVTDICGNTASSCVVIDQAKFREVNINDVIVDQTNRCVNNTVVAEVFYTGDANIRWSTGETTKSIVVNMDVTSSVVVTISDKLCPNIIDTLTVIMPQIQFITPIEIVFDRPVNCIDNKVKLTVVFDRNIIKPADLSIIWSTGATTESIEVTANGFYAVTVSDKNCPINRAGATINYEFPVSTVSIEPDSSALCTQGNILLSAILFDDRAPIQNPSYRWSTGATTTSIIINQSGTYSVTVSDPQCVQNNASAEFNFTFPNAGLKFASVFFPNTTDTITMKYNATFGPYLGDALCPESIENYEFYIFNRWGQKVFESFDLNTEWNGTMRNERDSNNPTEVYIWAVKYNLFGIEFKDHGDVTLIRP